MANPAPAGFQGFPNFNTPGFPYQNLVQQLLASMQQPASGSYGRWNGTGATSGLPPIPPGAPAGSQWIQGQAGSQQPPITPGMNLPPLNPGQSPFTAGLPNVGPAGYTGGGVPMPGIASGNVAPAGYAGTTKAGLLGGSQFTGANGALSALNPATLTDADKMYLDKLFNIPGVGMGSLESALGSNSDAIINAVQPETYSPSALAKYDPSTYQGPLRDIVSQYLQSNPNSQQMATIGGYGSLLRGFGYTGQ